MYSTMQAVSGTGVMAGFVHVPCSPELAARTGHPYLEVEAIARALTIAVDVSLEELGSR
jgi:pyrrolidone-carboxylate peptidase